MTAVHRRAAGADGSLPGVRPAIVVNDPALSASQPATALAASAANALGPRRRGSRDDARVARARAGGARGGAAHRRGVRRADGEPDRDTLALGALLSGYAIDGCGYGLHHVLSQTLARFSGAAHGPGERRDAAAHARRARTPRRAGRRRPHRARDAISRGARRPSACATSASTEDALDRCADAAARRAELDLTPPRADRDELRALYAAAF